MTGWQAANPAFESAVRDALATMPAARHLGFTLGRVAPGEAEIIQPLHPELTQHDGFAQGGVLGSLADFAAGAAAGTLLPPGWVNMTVDYTVKLVAPGQGMRIVARGRVLKPGSVLTVAAADVYAVSAPAGAEKADAETLCATALCTFRNVHVRVG
jgi:uncharacterized protein (TIGR00369 family)